MERDILHLAIPTYAVAVARVADPALRDRPVAIAPGTSGRAVIQSVSTEAAGDGILVGMTVRQARSLCPALLIRPPDPQLMSRADRALQKVVGNYSPLIEPHHSGRLFIDLSGTKRLLGAGRDVAMRLERELEQQLRLAAILGVAGNKLVSRIAAGCLERPGVCDVLRGAEQTFIAPLPVRVLPGIGSVREKLLLRELNLQKVRELTDLSLGQLRLIFGPFAPLVRQRALGQDTAPVLPPRRSPDVTAEGYLAHEDNDNPVLMAELARLVEVCGLRLRQINRVARELHLSIYYADGVRHSRSAKLSTPQNHDLLLCHDAEALFYTLRTRRTRVKGIRLSCRSLERPGLQGHLFAEHQGPSPRQQVLQETLDQLRSRYGMKIIRSGRTLVA